MKTEEQEKKVTVEHTMPEYVYYPVMAQEGYWELGLVEPNKAGYTPCGRIFDGQGYKEAVEFCRKEAEGRGISFEAYEATVSSSVFRTSFHRVLTTMLALARKKVGA